jgi:hypothetical protein
MEQKTFMFAFLRKTPRLDEPAPAVAARGNRPSQPEAPPDALLSTVQRHKPIDPLIGPKMGAKQVNNSLIHGLRNTKGVHIESYLTALGALAGFSCQMSLREALRSNGILSEENHILVISDGPDGKKYYFGEALNKPLAEDPYSVWNLASFAARKMGAPLPDIAEIFQHVSASIGTRAFGVPRLPDDRRPGDHPLNYLKALWPTLLPVVRPFCDDPAEWPILFAIAAQESIFMGKDVIDPGLAVSVVMESAVAMSKVDLPEFYSVAA